MKMFFSIVSTSLLLLFCVSSAFALEAPSQSESQMFRDVNRLEGIVIAKSERGCCVQRTSRVKCAYSDKRYCEAQAKKLDVTFEFYEGTSCRKIESCPER